MLHHIISITEDEAKKLKVKLHPSKYMHYVDYEGARVSKFFATEKQASLEVQKIKSSFNNFDTWEVVYYENVISNLGGQNNGN